MESEAHPGRAIMGSYNVIAHLVLFGWIPVVLVLFARFKPHVACTLAMLGQFLLLPASLAIDPPLLPPLDRHVIGGIGALLGFALFVRPSAQAPLNRRWPLVLLAVQVAVALVTTLFNRDPIFIGPLVLPGLTPYDGIGDAFIRMFAIAVPFYLGLRVVRSLEQLVTVLKIIAVAGLLQVPIVMVENRLSPQLHANLYGVFPHSFLQHIRAGGFRPVGLTTHGLEFALFVATATVAMVGLARAKLSVLGVRARWLVPVMLVGLVFCRSLGPLIYGLMFPAVIFLLSTRWQVRVVAVLIAVVLFYPLSRSRDLFPTETVVELATKVSPDRGQSIGFRFHHEDLLLEKADERAILGWGGWGRNRIFDRETGRDESVTDGYWILELGRFGLVGFLSFFVLLTAPAYLAARAWRRVPAGPGRVVLMTAVLIVVMRAVDLVPNAFLAPFTLYMAGALLGLQFPRRKHPRGSDKRGGKRGSQPRDEQSSGRRSLPGSFPTARGA